METVKWGIIGCGDVTEVKSGPAFQKIAHSELVAVMRRNSRLAEDYAKRHNVPKWYNDANDLLADPDINAVYIATPPSFHKEYAIATAKAGKPAYVEKPMSLTYDDCLEMINEYENRGVPLFVAYYRRALPRFLKIKELIDGEAIGKILSVQVTQYAKPLQKKQGEPLPWRVNPEVAGGGLFYDVGCHTLDFLDFILGPITKAKGHNGNQSGAYPAEDIVTGSFVFESGVQGIGLWCFSSYTDYDRVEICGSEGKILFSTFANAPVRLVREKDEAQYDIPHPVHIEQPMIEEVVNSLLGKGFPSSTGASAARTNWVMQQILGR